MKHFWRKVSFLILIYLLSVNGGGGKKKNRRRNQGGNQRTNFDDGMVESPSGLMHTQKDEPLDKADTSAKDHIPEEKVKVELNLFGALTKLKVQLQEKKKPVQTVQIKSGDKKAKIPEPPSGTSTYPKFSHLLTSCKNGQGKEYNTQ